MSEAPRRLLDDPAISDSLRNELETLRDGADVQYDEAKGLERLRAAIVPVAPTGPGDGGAGAGTAGGAGAAAAGGAKLVVIGVAAVIVIAGAIGIAKITGKHPQPAELGSAVSSTPSAVSTEPIEPKPAEDDDTPTLSLSALPAESAAPATARPSASSSSTPEQRLREEMTQLAEVRNALGGNPARAVALANEGHQKFKGGVFYQEREALAISALNRLGRSAEAKTRAQAFVAAYPKGPYAERIRKEAGLPPAQTGP